MCYVFSINGIAEYVFLITGILVYAFENVFEKIDYNNPVEAEEGFGFLPTSNVIKYIFKDGSWIAIRPSGTEPKIKAYYTTLGKDLAEAQAQKDALAAALAPIFS